MQQNKVGEPKLFKLLGHFSLAFFLLSTSLCAQSFEDFKRSQSESYKNYKDERDNTFNKYLKQQWKAYESHSGVKSYEEPKPKKIPQAKQIKLKSVGPKVSIAIKKVQPKAVDKVDKKPAVAPVSNIVVKPKKKIQIHSQKDINFNFYGTKLGFFIPSKIKSADFYPQNQKGITAYFDSAASSEYEELLTEIKNISSSMNLNDWGVYLLVVEISKRTYANEDNSRLLSWFLFNKLGYAVKVGLANKHVVLMHYSKKTIYSTPNYTFKSKKYYVVANYAKGGSQRLFSYEQDYPGSTKPLDLALASLPNLKKDMKKKTLSFKEFSKEYKIPFEYNQNLIDFMYSYPQADNSTYFNAPLDEMTYKSIATALKKYVDGKQAGDAMNFVLHFVQKSFIYSTDNVQFSREKVMFAQETLYFDKSDCEDRAVLFAYLIKELFGVSVVGVHYKGHMATALYVPMKGDTVDVGSRKFVVADPTYINANIGQTMPQFRSVIPRNFIVLKNKK